MMFQRNNLTKTPTWDSTDVLSGSLELLRAGGALFFRGSFAAPWAVEIPDAAEVARLLGAGPRDSLILFHTVLRGAPRLQIADQDCEPGLGLNLSAGDLVVLHDSGPHRVGEGQAQHHLTMESLVAGRADALPLLLEHGVNDSTTLICGGFFFRNAELDPMLRSLPPVVHVRADQTTGAIPELLQLLGRETASRNPGTSSVLSRLVELLLIEMLRGVAATLDAGWLAAIADPVVGRAIAALHAQPEEDWTVPRLARRVGVSRSGLNTRFRQLLDQSPGHYLIQLRMRLAEKLLREGRSTVAEVAERVGYDSVEGFSRSFKRYHGYPPSHARSSGTLPQRN